MRSEKEKMLAGELYDPADPELVEARMRARQLLKQLNEASTGDVSLRNWIFAELLNQTGRNLHVEPPFFCDYGKQITIGENVSFNFNCIILDVMPVTIGDNVLFGPNVQLYTASFPLNWQQRSDGLEYGAAITIGSNVWVGGSVVICPGVTIGNRSVIQAGSIVTHDIPDDVFAAGNPCRVIRSLLTEAPGKLV